MSISDLFYLEPYLWLAFGGLAVLLIGLLPSGNRWAFRLTVVVLIGTLLSCLELAGQHRMIESFILVNGFTQSAIALFCLIALAVVFMSESINGVKEGIDEIYYSLILFSVLGMALIPSENLIALLIGVEMITICGFCLTAWNPSRFGAVEAATKYVVTAGLATGFLLMGIALIYAGSGTVLLSAIKEGMLSQQGSVTLVMTGVFLLLTGIGFELAVAPFHCWLADLYEGAPVPIAAFIGSIAKLAVLAWLVLLPLWLDSRLWFIIERALSILAIISMVAGTILALRQENMKRLLAYSSVAHFGFILVALAVYQPASVTIIAYYGVVYAIATVAAFAIIAGLESRKSLSSLEDYRGLGRQYPLAGISLAIVMLSLGGIPPMAGFFAKLMLFQLTVNHNAYLLAIIIALTSAAGLYYYIRVLLVVFDKPPSGILEGSVEAVAARSDLIVNSVVIVVFVCLTALLGIFSQPLLGYASRLFL